MPPGVQFQILILENYLTLARDILDSPLWYNKKLINGNNFCIYEWYRKGIRHVSDLLDEQGNIYDFEIFKTRFGLIGTFLDFQALIRKIPNTNRWKTTLNNNKNICIINKFNVNCNVYIKLVLKDKKGCRRFYDLMTQSKKKLNNK